MLKMSIRNLDGMRVLDCSGRIVFGDETSSLRETVSQLLESSPCLILNLSGINYIDSGGLGTLVSLYTLARKSGGAIKLANLTPRVGDLMHITKLVTVFEVYSDEAQALKAFQRSAAA